MDLGLFDDGVADDSVVDRAGSRIGHRRDMHGVEARRCLHLRRVPHISHHHEDGIVGSADEGTGGFTLLVRRAPIHAEQFHRRMVPVLLVGLDDLLHLLVGVADGKMCKGILGAPDQLSGLGVLRREPQPAEDQEGENDDESEVEAVVLLLLLEHVDLHPFGFPHLWRERCTQGFTHGFLLRRCARPAHLAGSAWWDA